MNKKIDARGLACPKPVIMTKKALDELKEGTITTIVDNEAAKINVSKLAKKLNYQYTAEKVSDKEFHVTITKGEVLDTKLDTKVKIENENNTGRATIVISNDKMGKGSDELGKILIKSFIYTLTESTPYPETIIFYNGGVKLTVEGSEVIDDLKKLQEEGVEIISCGTCLDYYGLKDKLLVGEISNMYSIVEKLKEASNTITI